MENSRALKLGTVVHSRYRIEKILGEGGFGITYLVTDTKYNQPAALKEYMPMDIAYRAAATQEVYPQGKDRQHAYDRFLQKFLEEAQTIFGFRDHPNIVGVQHLFRENHTAYYVMEYVEGEDLGKLLQRNGKKLSWQQLQPILAQVIAALERIHSGKIVHCDISPDNIFVQKDGRVKLLDFGAAKNTLHNDMVSSFILQKPGYTPPEQAMSNMRMGPWTDVYALAGTIYRCVAGKIPPSYDMRLLGDKTVWPSQLGFSPPHPRWEAALQKGMELRKDDRYSNVTEFWQALLGEETFKAEIQCIRGRFEGRRFHIEGDTLLGVDAQQCQIVYPKGTPGISRKHLYIGQSDGTLYVMDMGSSYGTWLGRRRLTPGIAYEFQPGDTLFLPGGEAYAVAESE